VVFSGCEQRVSAGLPQLFPVRSGRACSAVGQGVAASGGLCPIVLCHNVVHADAQGQWLGRCSTGCRLAVRSPCRCLTCPQVQALSSSLLQRLTWPTSAPLARRGQYRYPASYPSRPLKGRYARLGFLLPFGHGRWLLGPSCVPATGGRSSSRSTHRDTARTRAGFPRSTCARLGRLPLPSGQPLHPGTAAIYPGLTLTRCRQRFTHVHPSDLPLTRDPRMDQGPLRLSPELRTSPLPATHVRGGDRATNTYPGYVIDSTADLHSTRHLHMRPRVARTGSAFLNWPD
jgi:hypothetical protein